MCFDLFIKKKLNIKSFTSHFNLVRSTDENLFLELSTKFTLRYKNLPSFYPCSLSSHVSKEWIARRRQIENRSFFARFVAFIPMHLIKCLFLLQQICQLNAARRKNSHGKQNVDETTKTIPAETWARHKGKLLFRYAHTLELTEENT